MRFTPSVLLAEYRKRLITQGCYPGDGNLEYQQAFKAGLFSFVEAMKEAEPAPAAQLEVAKTQLELITRELSRTSTSGTNAVRGRAAALLAVSQVVQATLDMERTGAA